MACNSLLLKSSLVEKSGHFEVVDARHDTGQIIVWAQSVFGSLANHRQAGFESLETPNRQLGDPVTNDKN